MSSKRGDEYLSAENERNQFERIHSQAFEGADPVHHCFRTSEVAPAGLPIAGHLEAAWSNRASLPASGRLTRLVTLIFSNDT
jgi:hypothetical protein